MNKKIGVLVILVLIAIASGIAVKKGSHQSSDRIAADIDSLNSYYRSPAAHIYSQYVKKSDFDSSSQTQQKYAASRALVINDNDLAQVARLKELKLNNVSDDIISLDTLNTKIDSITDLDLNNNELAGYVNLPADEVLYFPITYDKRWTVTVDVTELKPFKVNQEKMGIFLEKGRHHIALAYKFGKLDKLLFLAAMISLIAAFILFLIFYSKEITALSRPRKISRIGKICILAAGFVSITVILYLYFLKWKTNTAYGDDLYMFQNHWALHSFSQQLNMSQLGGKYRPINSLVFNSIIDLFHDNLNLYYVFNVLILSINTFICALILYPFLKSYLFSFLFSLTFGLSRFFYYSISQLLNGGALEGIALTWFLCFLLIVVNTMISNNLTPSKKYRRILLGILFANACLYTHERYISIFIFILAIVLLSRELRDLSRKQKTILVVLSILSPALNIFIKEYVYSIPFLLGTSDNAIKFSFSTPFSFFIDAILSLFQVNNGPDYCFGISFPALPFYDKVICILIVLILLAIIIAYFSGAIVSVFKYFTGRDASSKKIKTPEHFSIIVFLTVLLVLCISTCIFTVRLEHRWLAAPLSIFTLMIVIALTSVRYRNNTIKYGLFMFLISLILWINFSYLDLGINRIFMRNSENIAAVFKNGVNKKIVHKNSKKIYLWEKYKDINLRNDIMWTLGHGYFFKFYHIAEKEIVFVDSVYTKKDSSYLPSFPNFNPDTSQILLYDAELKDLTAGYLKDSLKNYTNNHN